MKIAKDISPPSPRDGYGPGARKYRFDSIAHGDSVHVETEKEMRSLRQSFRSYMQVRGRSDMRATSRAVDETDPEGTGWRIWFLSKLEGASDEI